MDIKPNTNITDADQDNRGSTTHVGGDQNVVNGQSVIAVVGGSGAIQADKIAIGDIYGDAAAPSSPAEFAELVSSLADLITEAKNAGELPDTMAAKAISSLVETTELIKKEEKPPKGQIMRRLQYVADVLEAAVDMFSGADGVASILLRALPVVNLLIRVAGRIL